MTRALKKPKIQTNIKFTLKNKIHNLIKNLRNNTYINIFEAKYIIDELKERSDNLYDEVKEFKNVLNNLKKDFGYEDFLEAKLYDSLKTDANKLYTKPINRLQPTTQALTVVKTGTLLDLGESTKKIAKFSLKSVLVSIGLTFINLFI